MWSDVTVRDEQLLGLEIKSLISYGAHPLMIQRYKEAQSAEAQSAVKL